MMECEILNKILESTVAQLFTLKAERPSPNANTTANVAPAPGPNKDKASAAGGSKPNDPEAINKWLSGKGRAWLEEAMSRLHVDYTKVTGKTLASKTHEELLDEKKKVKNELKRYDANFATLFGRAPGRTEKEPMRPLYMYYKKLKLALTKKDQPAQPSAESAQAKLSASVPGRLLGPTKEATSRSSESAKSDKQPAEVAKTFP